MENDENRFCAGCGQSVSNDTGDVVIVFGTSLWHMECFKCAKCNNLVNPDTNLLLLSDGSPVCANCYICKACNKPILDQAVMTGDDSFHADCFTCRSCKNRISELVFAKTVSGFYCMKCHNDRVARSRRLHSVKQKLRERERQASGGSDSRPDPSSTSNASTTVSNRDLNNIPLRTESKISGSSEQQLSVFLTHANGNSSNEASANGSNTLTRTDVGSINVSPGESYASFGNHSPRHAPVIPSYESSDVVDAHGTTLFCHSGSSTDLSPSVSHTDYTNGLNPISVGHAAEHANDETRKRYHDGARSPSHQTSSLELQNATRKGEERSSVNPNLQIDSSRTKHDRMDYDCSSIPSPLSPSGSTFTRNRLSSPRLGGKESLRVTSPLREYFVGSDGEVESAAQNSASTLPHPTSSASRQSFVGEAVGNAHGPDPGKSSTPIFPQRLDSLRTNDSAPRATVRGRARASPQPLKLKSASEEDDLRPPSRLNDAGTDAVHSRPISPKAPDVPRSIESGTDTETENGADSEDIMQTYLERRSNESHRESDPEKAPPPPPKESKGIKGSEGHNGSISVQSTEDNSMGSVADKDLEEHASPVTLSQRTSKFFTTPELPPMRFSLTRDLHDLLNNFSEPTNRLSLIAQHAALTRNLVERNDEISVARTPTSITSTIKPGSPSDCDLSSTGKERSSTGFRQSSEPDDTSKQPLTMEPDGLPISAEVPEAEMSSMNPSQPPFENETMQAAEVSMARNRQFEQDPVEIVIQRIKDTLADAKERSADNVNVEHTLMSTILELLVQKSQQVHELTQRLDGLKRTSQLMYDGFSSAHEGFSQEVEARKMAEEHVSRLKIELSGQAARLTMLTSEERKRELQKQLVHELSHDLAGLEMDLSKLKAERDVALAEVEELSATKSSAPGEATSVGVTRSLTMRLDKIRTQYMTDLAPLKQQRERLKREIAELKEARVIALEEAAVLSARNEELAQLNSQYEQRLDPDGVKSERTTHTPESVEKSSFEAWNSRQHQAPVLANATSTSSTATFVDDTAEGRQLKSAKPETFEAQTMQRTRIGLRWPGNRTANKDGHPSGSTETNKGTKRIEHTFQHVGTLRFGRCDFCNDKMWGSQVRCLSCNMTVHVRCAAQVHSSCSQDSHKRSDDHHAPSSAGLISHTVFGRDLIEQVREDSKIVDLFVPVIVEKCIAAVEMSGIEYEGIYRKSGGNGLSKTITSLFERGDYDSFDLCDPDLCNDISSVTSVLKNYFRTLPNPLLTFGLHDAIVGAAVVKDTQVKGQALRDLVRQLPAEHYHTLARLMTHLHRVQQHADLNLMNARNLGVIFGPTLMRAKDPSREFSDMAGKSLAIEWLIENAPTVFPLAT